MFSTIKIVNLVGYIVIGAVSLPVSAFLVTVARGAF